MKKIQYSVGMVKSPLNENDPEKAYANLQQTGSVSLDDLANHITEHNSVFSKGTIVGVLTELGDCIRELLLQGYRVVLGSIGSFVPSIHSSGAASREEFTVNNILSLRVRFTPGRSLQNLLRDAEFERTSTRRAQAATLAAETAGQLSVDLSRPVEEEDDEELPIEGD